MIEGQATWLSWAYLSKKSGGRGEVPPALLDRLAEGAGASGDDFPVFYTGAAVYPRVADVSLHGGHALPGRGVSRAGSGGVRARVSRSAAQHAAHHASGDVPSRRVLPTKPALPRLEESAARRPGIFESWPTGTWANSTTGFCCGSTSAKPRVAKPRRIGGAEPIACTSTRQAKYPVLAHSSEWDSPEAAQDVLRPVPAGAAGQVEETGNRLVFSRRQVTGFRR